MPPEPPTDAPAPPPDEGTLRALVAFRALFRAHRALGQVEPLAAYEARFPGHRAALAAEYERLSAEAPRVEPPSGMEEVVARLATRGAERYRTVEELGRGGMGIVLRVRDDALGRDLAMKIMPAGEGRVVPVGGAGDPSRTLPAPGPGLLRFLQEARVTAQLDHPGIVPVHELGADADGYAFFTMKIVRGLTLAEALRLARPGHGGWSLARAVQMLLRICETVAFAHTRGVIHRDLKPANIMVGDFGQVYVMDWGLAKVIHRPGEDDPPGAPADPPGRVAGEGGAAARPPATPRPGSDPSPATQAGSVLGTAHYMPPEQAAGRVDRLDARSDVYSLGAILYEVLGGVPPYGDPGSSPPQDEVVRAVLVGPPRPLREIAPGVPPELEAVAARAMRRDPAERYASAQDLADDLHRFLEGRVVRAYRAGPLVELRKWVARNRAVAATATAAILLAVGGAAALAVQERRAAEAVLAERNTAVAARDDARAHSRRADGLRLAAQSLLVAPEDPTLALLLAIEAAGAAPGLDSSTALHRALGLHRERRRLSGHDDYLHGACFSPDGATVLTFDAGRLACLWDADSGRLLHRLDEHGDRLSLGAFSPGGDRVVTASHDGTARTYDAASGRLLAVLRGHGAAVLDACFDPRGALVATASPDGTARVFDAATGEEKARFDGHGAEVRSVAFAPAGDLVVSTGGDQRARAWRVADGAEAWASPISGAPDAFPPYEFSERHRDRGPPDGARFLPGGAAVVTDSTNGEVRVLDAADGRLLRVLGGPVPPARLAGNPTRDGEVLLRSLETAAGASPWMAVADATGVRPPRPLPPPARPAWACLSPDGRRIALGSRNHEGFLLDAATGAVEARLLGHFYSVVSGAFSPDGTRVVTGSTDMTARIFDAAPGGRIRLAAGGGAGRTLAVDPGVRRAVLVHEGAGDSPGAVEVADPRTGEVLARLDDPGFVVRRASFDGPGARVALAGDPGVRTWDPATGRLSPLHALPEAAAPVFDPGGRLLAVRARDSLEILDAATCAPAGPGAPFPAPSALDVAWSPDGRLLVTPDGRRATVTVRDAATGAERLRLAGHTGYAMHAVVSPDGRTVASTAVDRSVRAWDLATGRPIFTSRGIPMEGHVLAYSPDGGLLAACGRRQFRMLRASDGETLATVDGPDGAQFTGAWFTPDGGTVALAAIDGTLRLLPVDPLAAARARAPRALDAEESERHGIGSPDERRAARRARVLREGRMRDLLHLGLSDLEEGDEAAAREAFEAALRARPRMPQGHLGMACLEAHRAGRLPGGSAARAAAVDAAFARLEDALARGFEDPAGLDGFEALAPLRADPRRAAAHARAIRRDDPR